MVCLILLALGLALVSCNDDTTSESVQVDDPLLFYGTSGGETVTVTISQTDPAKAVLTVKGGEFYEIRWGNDVISTGKLGKILDTSDTWFFVPSSDSPGTKTLFNAAYDKDKKMLFFSSIPGTGISNLTVSVNGSNVTAGDSDDNNDLSGNGTSTDNGNGNSTITGTPTNDITWTAAADGTLNTVNSTKIIFSFGQNVTGLMAGNITITNDTGTVSKGSLSGSGKAWSLGITVSTQGNVKVKISLAGVSTAEKTVAVYKSSLPLTLDYLNVHIKRYESSDTLFVFSVDAVFEADYYEIAASGTYFMGADNDYLLVPDVCLTDRQLTPFTVQAVGATSYASLETDVPGMVKYPDATKTLDSTTDWFNFLEAGMKVLALSGSPDYGTLPPYLYQNIKNALDDAANWNTEA